MTAWLIRLFVKDADQVKDPAVRRRYGVLGGAVGIACNLLLFLMKFLTGMFTGSVAISADAFNTLSDAGSSVVTVAGFQLSGKKPDKKHPFGYGRIEYVAGLCISLVILLVGFEFLRTSIDKVMHPETAAFSWVSVLVLGASILVKLWMGLFHRKIGKSIGSATVGAAALDSLSDVAATSVVLISVFLSQITDFPVDGAAGIVVALFILWAGITTAKDTLSPLLGQPPDPKLVKDIEESLLSYEGIGGVHDLIVHSYGPGRIIASVHAEVPADANILKMHETIDLAEKEISAKLGIMLIVHFDPILTDDKRINHLHETASDIVLRIDPALSLHDFRVVDGENRINLIFDVVVPYDYPVSDEKLEERMDAALKAVDPRFFAVVSFDRSFLGE